MKLSQDTTNALKHLSTINCNIRVLPGNKLETMNRSVICSYLAAEVFPAFAIDDLSEFINILSLYKDCDIDFGSNYITITENNQSTQYGYGDPQSFNRVPPNKINMPDPEVKFKLNNQDLNSVLKAASILKIETIIFKNNPENKNTILLQAKDTNLRQLNIGSNSFSTEIPGEYNPDLEFNIIFDVKNLTLFPGEYDVECSSQLICKFTNLTAPMTYYIGPTKNSTFTGV
jgi:hypothetical protein